MRSNRVIVVLALMLVAAPACGALPANEPGAIAMAPFTFPDMGVQGMVPNACPNVGGTVFVCEALPPGEGLLVLQVIAVDAPLAELKDSVVEDLDLDSLPDQLGSYRGRALAWQWYELDSTFEGQGLPPPEDGQYRFDLALAESDERTFGLAMITNPSDRERHRRFYDAVLTHALYAVEPVPTEVAPGQEES